MDSAVETISKYSLTLDKVNNPEVGVCISQNPIFSIFDTQSQLLYYSAYTTKNMQKTSFFTPNKDTTYLDLSLSEDFLSLKQGTVSKSLYFVNHVSGSYLQSPLQIDVDSQSGFTLLQSHIYVYPLRNTSTSFVVVASFDILPGIYLLKFIKSSDPYQKYGDLPILKIVVLATQTQILIDNLSPIYTIPYSKGSSSLPIIVNIVEHPSQSLILDATINNPSLNITFEGGITTKLIEFTPQSPLHFAFLLYLSEINNAVSSINNQTFVQFSVKSPFNETYVTPSVVYVGFETDRTAVPSFLLDTDAVSTHSTSATVLLSCDQNGIIYFSISSSSSLSETYDAIKQKALNFTDYEGQSSLNQRQYSFIIVNSTNSGYNISYNVNNLLSNFSYKVLGFCVNQAQVMSISVMKTFRTKFNGGFLQRLSLEYETPLKNSQIQRLLCYLDVYFGLAIEK